MLSPILGNLRHRQGRILGLMEVLGPAASTRLDKNLRTEEPPAVFSTFQEAARHYKGPLTEKKLSAWQKGLHPGKPARASGDLPLQGIARSFVYALPPRSAMPIAEIRRFISWFNHEDKVDLLLKAGIAYRWFKGLTPDPLMAHLVTTLMLCRALHHVQRLYSLTTFIDCEQKHHPASGPIHEWPDITPWLEGFLICLDRALAKTENELLAPTQKARLQNRFGGMTLNERQERVMQTLLESAPRREHESPSSPDQAPALRISSSQWARLAGCSQDTALRDIQELMDRSILYKVAAGGRSTHYGFAAGFGSNS